GNPAPIKPASTIGFPPISLFAENFPDKTQGLGCDLLRIALLDRHPLPMKKEAYMKAIPILSIGALAAISAGCLSTRQSVSATGERYPWKKNIATTVFWIGDKPSANIQVPNRKSSWDEDWSSS